LAKAFESDFWKDAKSRKVWDDIVPGEPRKTLPYLLTLEAIHRYCRAVGFLSPHLIKIYANLSLRFPLPIL